MERENGSPIRGASVKISDAWGFGYRQERRKNTDADGMVIFEEKDLRFFMLFSDGSFARDYQGPGTRVERGGFQFRIDLEVESPGLQPYRGNIVFVDGDYTANITLSSRVVPQYSGVDLPPPPFPYQSGTFIELRGRWTHNDRSDRIYESLQQAGATVSSWGPNNERRPDSIVYENTREAAEWLKENIPLLAGFPIVQANNLDRDVRIIRIYIGFQHR